MCKGVQLATALFLLSSVGAARAHGLRRVKTRPTTRWGTPKVNATIANQVMLVLSLACAGSALASAAEQPATGRADATKE